jgi:glutamate 5-kinase
MKALVSAGTSLLPVGVVGVEGSFTGGAAVEVLHEDRLIAKGLAAMSAADILRVRGEHSSVAGGEVIHRDDLVVLT